MNRYLRFGLMILTSTILMYTLTYANNYATDHVYFSQTRVYMAILMGSMMAIVMLLFMLKMYRKKKLNVAIIVLAIAIGSISTWLVRSQKTIDDVAWMKAMIPHHSIAVLTSERAHISDSRVQQLAREIIAAQRREIEQMKGLIDELESRPRGSAE